MSGTLLAGGQHQCVPAQPAEVLLPATTGAALCLAYSNACDACPQVSVHARLEPEQAGGSAFASCCFECHPKPVPKTFPACTIRSTPDKPIHCIVWAKELLFQRLFGRCVPPQLVRASGCRACTKTL